MKKTGQIVLNLVGVVLFAWLVIGFADILAAILLGAATVRVFTAPSFFLYCGSLVLFGMTVTRQHRWPKWLTISIEVFLLIVVASLLVFALSSLAVL